MAPSKQQLIAEAVAAGSDTRSALAKLDPNLATTIAIGILLETCRRLPPEERRGIGDAFCLLLEVEDDHAAQ